MSKTRREEISIFCKWKVRELWPESKQWQILSSKDVHAKRYPFPCVFSKCNTYSFYSNVRSMFFPPESSFAGNCGISNIIWLLKLDLQSHTQSLPGTSVTLTSETNLLCKWSECSEVVSTQPKWAPSKKWAHQSWLSSLPAIWAGHLESGSPVSTGDDLAML